MNRIALFVPVLNGGGAERMMLHLGLEFARRGHQCDLIVATDNGPPLENPPSDIGVVRLHKRNCRRAIPSLAAYLRRAKPDVLMSTVFSANVAAIIAAKLSQRKIRVVLREASRTDAQIETHCFRNRIIDFALRRLVYPMADYFVAVSDDVRLNLIESCLATRENSCVIYNPITRPAVAREYRAPEQDPPELLACGRLEAQKDYPTLLRALSVVLRSRRAKLSILGEGSLREDLEELAKRLGVSSSVSFEGFVDDPTPFLRRASVFVHTSKFEGFPSAILEAVLSGCQVVATDAPGGAREILQGGLLGTLVPVGDYEAVGKAILRFLSAEGTYSIPSDYRHRFSLETAATRYLEVILPANQR